MKVILLAPCLSQSNNDIISSNVRRQTFFSFERLLYYLFTSLITCRIMYVYPQSNKVGRNFFTGSAKASILTFGCGIFTLQ